MSTQIKTNCPACGDVSLRESGVLLTLYDWGTIDTYHFFCPGCKTEIVKPATDEIVQLLEHVVNVQRMHVPLEIQEDGRSGPALTSDDVMEFILELHAGPVSEPRRVVPKDCEPIRSPQA